MTIRNVTRHWNLQRRHWTVSFFFEVKYTVLGLPSVIAHSLLCLLTIAALLLLQLNFRCILPWLLGDRQINKPENVFKFFVNYFLWISELIKALFLLLSVDYFPVKCRTKPPMNTKLQIWKMVKMVKMKTLIRLRFVVSKLCKSGYF